MLNRKSLQPVLPIETAFIRWSLARAILHRGWWLVTSLYLVTVAGLTPAQLVYIGVFQGIVSLLFEVPAGVIADTLSRKWAIVISHVLMGTAMLVTGLVTDFPIILATQMLWGISWTFSSGADVAWVTDELNQPDRIARVLNKSVRAELFGAAIGIVGIGMLAWVTSLSTAMVFAGTTMLILGLYVIFRFREDRFIPTKEQRWLASWEIFKTGIVLVRKSRIILLMFIATFLVNGAADVGRLYPKRLNDIGFPVIAEPIVWWTGLGILSYLLGAVALRIVEKRVHDIAIAKRDYALACAIGAVGLILLAAVPSIVVAFIGIMLMDGIRSPLTRTLAMIQVNKATTDNARATVHSFLAQSEYLGEIVCGLAIGVIAQAFNLPMALTAGAALLVATAFIMVRPRLNKADKAVIGNSELRQENV